MQIPGILIVAILWLVIGLPLSKISQQAKKNAAKNAAQHKAQNNAQQPAAEPAKPAAPAREPLARESRLTPSISVTEHDDSVYQGSMFAVTGEGYDPCHDEQIKPLTEAESAVPAPVEEIPGLQLGWSGNDVVRGLVMSEILNRRGRAS